MVNERADIEIGGKKISGAAYRITKDRAYHHGTVLINSDLRILRGILKSPIAGGIEAMGAKSKPASVCNVGDHDPRANVDSVVEAVAKEFNETLSNPVEIEEMGFDSFGGVEEVEKEVAMISNKDWIYGQTPRFSHSLNSTCGELKLHMEKGAKVESVELHSRNRSQCNGSRTLCRSVDDRLVGTQYGGNSLRTAVEGASNCHLKFKDNGSSNDISKLIPEIPA